MRFQTIGKLSLWLVLMLSQAVAISSAQARSLPDFTPLVEQARPAVVNISTSGSSSDATAASPGGKRYHDFHEGLPFDELLRKFFEDRGHGETPRFNKESLGSGFIISADGYVLTNYHVVQDAGKIIVRLSDRREFEARLVGVDKRSDIALLKIKADHLPVVKIGDSSKLKVGEWVLAIGSPFGFEHSVTAGIVSAKGRTLPNENYVPFIQTDVAINPGNSGGPLFNMEGEVVGINSQIFSRTGGYMGLSFAIPSNMAMDVVAQLKGKGRVSRGWLGVYIQDVTGELAESFGLDKPRGALVARVLQGSPAQKAGLRVGDVIVDYDGRSVDRSSALPPMVGRTRVGSTVDIRVFRDGKPQALRVRIDELPEIGPHAAAHRIKPPDYNERLAVAVAVPDKAQREALDLGEHGVLIRRVEPGPARQAGIRKGDAIVMVNGVRIKDIGGLNKAVDGLPANKPVSVLVHRRGGPLFLSLKLAAR